MENKESESRKDIVNVNIELKKLIKEMSEVSSFLDKQAFNETENLKFVKSDWMQGLCEGKKLAYEVSAKIIMNNLEQFK